MLSSPWFRRPTRRPTTALLDRRDIILSVRHKSGGEVRRPRKTLSADVFVPSLQHLDSIWTVPPRNWADKGYYPPRVSAEVLCFRADPGRRWAGYRTRWRVPFNHRHAQRKETTVPLRRCGHLSGRKSATSEHLAGRNRATIEQVGHDCRA